MWSIAAKEFRELLFSPKYILTFAVSAVLIFISVFNGWSIYEGELAAAEEIKAAAEERMGSSQLYRHLSYLTPRYPEKTAIFDIGISGLIGSKAYVYGSGRPSISENRYERYPVLAVFGELDLAFTVTYILSVFAILFSFSSINGEKEAGTLQLMLSNSVKRPAVVLGKLAGGFLPIALLFLLPFIMSLVALLILTDVNFGPGEWLKIGLMALAFLLYLLLFHSMGVAMSALTRSSFVSFLFCLLFWVLSAAIIPKGAVQLASHISPSMNIFDLDNEQRLFWKQVNEERMRDYAAYFEKNRLTREQWREKRMEFSRAQDKKFREKREEFDERIWAEFIRRRKNMLSTAVSISRASPSSCLTFALHGISDTGPRALDRFEDELREFQKEFKKYSESQSEKDLELEKQLRSRRWYEVVPDANGFMTVKINEQDFPKLDISGMPRYEGADLPMEAVVEGSLVDMGLLAFFTLFFFAVAYVAFLRYDVR
jgi:ABC-type transport system involved in multi-copper enzyme maturation permease subunit